MATSTNIPEIEDLSKVQEITRESKTFVVTLSYELAAKLEALTQREGRETSEILATAFQEYYGAKVSDWLTELREYAATRNPHGYTEEDIPRLVKEVRAEQAAEEAALEAAKAS